MQIRGADRKVAVNSVHRATLERRSFIVQAARARAHSKNGLKWTSPETEQRHCLAPMNATFWTVSRLTTKRCNIHGVKIDLWALRDRDPIHVSSILWRISPGENCSIQTGLLPPTMFLCSRSTLPSTSDVATVRNAQTRAPLPRPFPIPSNFLQTRSTRGLISSSFFHESR